MTTVVLADDHAVFTDALCGVLTQAGHTVVGTASTIRAAVEQMRACHPDLCLLDRRFGDGDAIGAIGEILAGHPGSRLVVLTAEPGVEGVHRAMAAGAAGYIHKTCGVSTLLAALDRVLAGEIVVHLPHDNHPDNARHGTDTRQLAGYLTARERECLALLVEGLGTTAMARRMGVSVATVRSHVQALLTKLGAHSRVEVASLAVRHSLLD